MGNQHSNCCNYSSPGQLKQFILDCKEAICHEKVPLNYPPMNGQGWPEKEITDEFDSKFKRIN